jgi:cholesterol transport system auxiliary component
MKSRKIIAMIVVPSMIMLSGCSFLSPVKTESPTKYVINKIPDNLPVKKTRHITLMVSATETRPIYDTTQMAYSIKPYQIAYFSKNQWAETPAQMLHPLLLQTLQDTHYFHTIVTPPFTGHYDYTVTTQILELKQDFTTQIPVLRMSVRAQITRTLSNQVMATRQFSSEVPIPQRSPYGGVFAANRATDIILQQIAYFCLETIH